MNFEGLKKFELLDLLNEGKVTEQEDLDLLVEKAQCKYHKCAQDCYGLELRRALAMTNLSDSAIDTLLDDDDSLTRSMVAASPYINLEHMRRIVKDPLWTVRITLAERSDLNEEILTVLLGDANAKVREQAELRARR